MKPGHALAAFVTCTALAGSPAAAAHGPRSQDDRGFSITLVSPTDIYLTGRRTMRIEPIIPHGDSIEQVDFFVDGRLAFIDVREPYAHEADFGDDIRRHAIEVRALTRQGRRAKVSMVSRSADLTDGAVGRVETMFATVRDVAGRPVDGLSVSDFLLREDGVRQPIVHFEGGGSPSSLALVVAPGDLLPAREVHDRLAAFLLDLPRHHAAVLVEDAPAPERPAGAAFTYDLGTVADRLRERADAVVPAEAVPDLLARAVAALEARRGARVILLVVASPGPRLPAGLEPAESGAGPAAGPPAGPPESEPPRPVPLPPADLPPEPMEPALEAAWRARAVIYCVALGGTAASGACGGLEIAAARSGGRCLPAADLPDLEPALGTVAEALRHRYLISYMPAERESPGDRRIDVSVSTEGLSVEAPRSLPFP